MKEASVAAAVILADRATKAWAQEWLFPRSPVAVFPFFHLTYVENTGAAFGLLPGANLFFVAIAAALLGGLLFMRRSLAPAERAARLGVALVSGGALGNLYDRLAYGHVVDFLDFRVWPVFNVADSSITVGAVLLALVLGKGERKSAA
ncbi:MAG: signal peptidase II [Elusimicrobia bacterium]|nr:signal peptidase II [Elusimicrobiota bacterium]